MPAASIEPAAFIKDVPDFPKKGIVFKDITPLLGDYYTAVTSLAPSLDGTRLGYLLQGRTASFGFLQ